MKKQVNTIARGLTLVLVDFIIATLMGGCGIIDSYTDNTLKDKERVQLGQDGKSFTYKNQHYNILDTTESNDNKGQCMAYIRHLAAYDHNGKLIRTRKITHDMKSVKEFVRETRADRVISFMDIYQVTQQPGSSRLLVEVDGHNHEAEITSKLFPGTKLLDTTGKR
ncbi:NisI/SpaI family lantibiotic immunity lipoprotein [Bifidobacterium sp. ESL0798]|uniref:NisI/SpaI family lantibiotic immunity lipoprotein n=1 Tax=Bifidobacterium sp. ESL0798 TaxID=2983235 RepID=UPI0023F84222|nr:NisI/SpaI family lantibiotic immunity lipoprotein [Bifidobacterium sp. ESL0798]WEV73479.1 NisI/SpaI family lantibiotic immunity lipoprotein [Bifidobacterium sp. ESL0798]